MRATDQIAQDSAAMTSSSEYAIMYFPPPASSFRWNSF
jgi:hypothetical protein